MTTNSANTANTAIAKEAVEANGAQSQRTNPPTLRLDNVSYAYAKGGKRVLKNISHDSQAGKVHAITGPSGAGKTTLLSLISGLATPHGRDGAGRRHRPVGTRPIPFSQP